MGYAAREWRKMDPGPISEGSISGPMIRGYHIEDIPWPFQDAMRKLACYERLLPFISDAEQMKELFFKGFSPERVIELNQMYSEKCAEVRMLREHGGWIPCRERLPELPEWTEDRYLPEFIVTVKGDAQSRVLKYAPDGIWFDDWGEMYDVEAWMPFPQIYRGVADK